MNIVTKTLQSVSCEMAAVVPLYESFENFINYVRNNFKSSINEAEKLAGENIYETNHRFTPKVKCLT